MSTTTRKKSLILLAVIAISTPLALGVETGLRLLLFPAEFEELRMFLRPSLTPWLWAAPGFAAVFTLLGIKLQRWAVAKRIESLPEDKRTPQAEQKAHLDALMLSTSSPQIPALFATFGFMFGSELLPVVVTIAVATAGVLVIWVVLPDPSPE